MNIEVFKNHYSKLMGIFEGYPLKIINVYCPLEVCRQRNFLRGDRRKYQSLEQSRIAERDIEYLLSIDTSKHTTKECADIILKNI